MVTCLSRMTLHPFSEQLRRGSWRFGSTPNLYSPALFPVPKVDQGIAQREAVQLLPSREKKPLVKLEVARG